MVNPYFAVILMVILVILLGMNGYSKNCGLFGAANQKKYKTEHEKIHVL